MEYKADALLLRAVDYGENDKMVTLLTAERGKIGAAMKGVKKAGARLRFAAQPFCFAEYVFAEKGGRYTVTQASLHDGFYGLRERIGSYWAAAGVTEVCAALSYEGMESGALLVAAVEALGALEEGEAHPALVRFLLRACAIAGYPVAAEECPYCGRTISGRMMFDMESGAFGCAACAGKAPSGVPASETTYRAIRAAYGGGESDRDGQIRAVRLLKAYLVRKTETEFPALGEALACL